MIAKITPCFENGKGALAEGLLNGIGFGTTELIVVRPHRDRVLGRYLHWLFSAPHFRDTATASMYGAGGQKRVPDAFVRDFRVALPSKGEQSAIAAFLDHETAKIDALVAEQERLIALLKEKRQAVISHAVTKGLDPNAPMKDSGVEWLGQVPAHWDVMAVRLIFELGRGRVISHEGIYNNLGDYPVYSSQTENDGEMGRIDTFDFEGDYLTWTTDGANAGTVFRRHGRFSCTNVCGTMKLKVDSMSLEYLCSALACCTAAFVRQDINPKLMNNVMATIRIPVPPPTEQCQIASLVCANAEVFDTLSAEATRAIILLRERRATLISAAVTGKIDVRGVIAVPAAEAA